jgi:cyanophycin synthetase
VKGYLSTIEATEHVGVISGTGDRRDEDIRETGRISARMFDRIIISQERYLRGRTQQEIINLLLDGIHEIKPEMPVIINNNGDDCLKYIMASAKSGSFISILSNTIENAIGKVLEYRDKDLGMK